MKQKIGFFYTFFFFYTFCAQTTFDLLLSNKEIVFSTVCLYLSCTSAEQLFVKKRRKKREEKPSISVDLQRIQFDENGRRNSVRTFQRKFHESLHENKKFNTKLEWAVFLFGTSGVSYMVRTVIQRKRARTQLRPQKLKGEWVGSKSERTIAYAAKDE